MLNLNSFSIKLIGLLLFIQIGFSQGSNAQTVIYVDSANVNGTHNGTSWTTAYNNFATALASATSGTQIWVAKGTYQPASVTYFQPKADNVKIYGGFPGYPNTTAVFSDRNSSTNVTILKGNGAAVFNYTATLPAITTATVLDGFTITGGTSPASGNAGGIYTAGSPTLSNLIITGNSATPNTCGGGLTVSGSSPIVTNVTISNNSAFSGGGILFTNGTAASLMTPVLTNVTISGNTSSNSGGGIAWNPASNNNYSLTLNGVIIKNNTTNGDSGGGLYIGTTGGNMLFSLDSVVFDGNTVNGTAGLGGAIYLPLNAGGAGMRMIGTQVVFANNSIPNGTNYNAGGAVYDGGGSGSYFKFTDALFYNNSVTSTSAAYGAAFAAGAASVVNTRDTLINATFVNNSVKAPIAKGGAVWNNINPGSPRNMYVANSVFYNNSKTISGTNSSSDVEYGTTSTPGSLIYSYLQNTAITGANITASNNVVSTTNPFNSSSPKGADVVWMTVDDGFHVLGTSAAYNSGSNAIVNSNQIITDITGYPRIEGGTVEMGAYETGLWFSVQPVSQVICPGSTQTITFNATAASIIPNDVITLQWQKNGVNVGSPVTLNSAPYNTSYTITAATTNDTASYTVIATDATFGSVPSNIAKLSTYGKVLVSPASQSPICSGGTPVTQLSTYIPSSTYIVNYASSIVRWEYSYSNFGSPADSVNIASSANSILSTTLMKPTTAGGITGTIYYRALVQTPGCAASYSDTAVVPVTNSATLSPSQAICSPVTASPITTNIPATGNTFTWQYSTTPNFASPTTISGATGNSLTAAQIGSFSGTLYYRVTVKNSACPNGAYSSIDSITMSTATQGGNPQSSTTTICGGTQPSPLTLSGATGNVQYWQYSASNFTTADSVNIPSSMVNTLSSSLMGNLYANRQYRAVVKNGACSAAYSGFININVNMPVGGKVTPNQTICYGSSPNQLSVDNTLVGSVMYWQSSASGTFGADTVKIPVGGSSLSQGTMGNLTSSNYYRAVVQYSGCAPVVYSTIDTIIVSNTDTWTGATSTAWNTASNWACNYVPLITTDVLIPSGLSNYPLVNTSTAALSHNITIGTGASVTVISDTLRIAGAINNSGIINAQTGSIELKGSSAQTIDGTMFAAHTIANLIINNGSTVNIASTANDTLSIANVLSFGNINNATLNTGGNIELLSDCASVTARVADITNNGVNSGNQITGKAIVCRCIPAHRAWRLLTAPVSSSNTIYQAWQNNGVYNAANVGRGTLITMPNPSNGLDAAINGNYSMFNYADASQQFSALSNTQVPISQGGGSSVANTPYMIFIRGDRNPLNVANPIYNPPTHITVLRSYGNLQTYDQVFNAAIQDSGHYSAFGNPYASPIDFGKAQLSNIVNRVYIWNANLNQVGGFEVLDGFGLPAGSYYNNVSNKNQSAILQSGQAFLVQNAQKGPASITIQEGAKTAGDDISVFRLAAPQQTAALRLLLNSIDTNGVTLVDAAVAQFNNEFSAAVDQIDALKLNNINEGLGLLRDGQTLSIERRPLVVNTDTLYLKLTSCTIKNYQLELDAAGMLRPGLSGRLIDTYLDTSVTLDLTGQTLFNYNVTSIAASAATNRFMIVFKQDTVLPLIFTSVAANQQAAGIAVNWTAVNEKYITQYEVQRSTDGVNFTAIGTVAANNSGAYQWIDSSYVTANVSYRIKAIDIIDEETYSDAVKINDIKSSITIVDNNYDANGLVFKFNNMQAGAYTARLISVNGQLLGIKSIQYAGGTSNVPLNFGRLAAKGIYITEILSPDKQAYSFKVNGVSQ